MAAEPQVNGQVNGNGKAAEAAHVSAATAQPVVSALRAELRQFAGELHGPVRRIRIRAGEVAVEVEWQPTAGHGPRTLPSHALAALPAPPTATEPTEPTEPPAVEPVDGTGERTVVTSPMVGTFYHAPEPGADPYVSVGDEVEAGQVVGIVEAMKLMNPIAAEVPGTVVEVLVGNAQPVEFGQPLLALAPASSTSER
ncbi:MAG: acetyl-CoA carboxylase biotin carboxyl carrier protein [Mycobacteriales bacterium]